MASEYNFRQPYVRGILNRIQEHLKYSRRDVYEKLSSYRLWTLATQRGTKWSRGKLYYIEGNKLFLVPTNYPGVNYLNLEEFSFGYPENTRNLQPVIPRYDWKSPFIFNLTPSDNHNPLVEDSEERLLRRHFADYGIKFLQNMTEMREWCYFVMQHEYELASVLVLLKEWDAGKCMKLVQRFVNPDLNLTKVFYFFDNLRIFLSVLIACCEDSLIIVEAISKLCQPYMAARGCVRLTIYQNIFCRCHLQLANTNDSRYEERIPKTDILHYAFIYRNPHLMKLGLELWSSSGYSNPICSMVESIQQDYRRSALCVESTLWPRERDQLHVDSFHSVEFFATFSHITVWAVSLLLPRIPYVEFLDELRRKEAQDHIERRVTQCFQLLWRAVPTPYLPVEDTRCVIDFNKVREHFGAFYNRLGDIEERVFWTKLAKLLEDDFSSEFMPRSLQHLSRFAVRKIIRSPEQISSLSVPSILKRYLLLEW